MKTGYEISFNRYFYKPQPMRTLEEIRADIVALEKETEGLLGEILGEARPRPTGLKPYLAMKRFGRRVAGGGAGALGRETPQSGTLVVA